jgi:hypothetical protein
MANSARPRAYPRAALATVSTHELPTLAGWWAGRDLEWRERLALFPGEAQRKSQLEERATDRARLARALGIDAAGAKPEAFLACRSTPTLPAPRPWSWTVQIEDALGARRAGEPCRERCLSTPMAAQAPAFP